MILPVYRLTLRALLLQRRTIMLAVVVLAPVATALIYALARPGGSDTMGFYSDIVQKLFVPAVAALVALVFGVSAFGDEREDGTILYLVATPQPRLELVVAKMAAAWTASLVLLVPSLVLSGLLGLGSAASLRLIGWPLLGVVLASLAYCAASSWLSLKTRRPVVIGVIYILLWEGSVATYAASAAKLSISAYGSAFVAHALPQSAPPVAGLVPSAVVLVAVVVLAALGAARSLGRTELP
jgi:ABC-2 type transport system permease protein